MATVTELETKITELKEKLREVKGKRTEVYTRIVGYYRPVSNWNKGKYSEYQDRSEYSTNPNLEIVSEKKEETNTVEFIVNDKGEAKNYKLFYSDTCPSCPPVKNCLNQVDILGEHINASTEAGLQEASKYQVQATPTVIFFNDKGDVLDTAHTPGQIQQIVG